MADESCELRSNAEYGNETSTCSGSGCASLWLYDFTAVRVGGLAIRVGRLLGLPVGARVLSVGVGGLFIGIRSGLLVGVGRILPVGIGCSLPVAGLAVRGDACDIRRLCGVRLPLRRVRADATLHDHQLRGVPARGDEAAPHQPEAKDGDADVAAGRNVPGLTISADDKQVHDPGDAERNDDDDDCGVEFFFCTVVVAAIGSAISPGRGAVAV